VPNRHNNGEPELFAKLPRQIFTFWNLLTGELVREPRPVDMQTFFEEVKRTSRHKRYKGCYRPVPNPHRRFD